MKKFLALGAIVTIGGLTLAGCPKPDAAPEATSATTTTAAAPAETTPSAAPVAVDTAKIKTAILADEGLKDAKIDVEVKETTVMLKGSVKNNDLKKKAGELATAAAPGATVKNMLLVK